MVYFTLLMAWWWRQNQFHIYYDTQQLCHGYMKIDIELYVDIIHGDIDTKSCKKKLLSI